MFAHGTKPFGRTQSVVDDPREIEVYSQGRFFCVTGHRWGDAIGVFPRQEEIDCLQANLECKSAERRTKQWSARSGASLVGVKALKASRAGPYQDWLVVGMALHSVGDDYEMLAAWKEFSALCSEKFSDQACEQKWRSFNGSGVTIGTLIKWAKEDGWQRPSNGCRQQGEATKNMNDSSGYDVILAFFRKEYDPTFRRETHIYSSSLDRTVSKSEVLAGPPKN